LASDDKLVESHALDVIHAVSSVAIACGRCPDGDRFPAAETY